MRPFGLISINTDCTNNIIEGNYIGTDPTGTLAQGNAVGVLIGQAQSNTVGGTVAGARNLISGNDGDGVVIFSVDAAGNLSKQYCAKEAGDCDGPGVCTPIPAGRRAGA